MHEAVKRQEPGIEPAGDDGSFWLPLSHEQARLWFLSQANPADVSYHMAYRIELAGRLDAAALSRAVDQVVARHEVLRTRYVEVDGEPRQYVFPRRVQRIDLVDLSHLTQDVRAIELARLEQEVVHHPFDLAAGDLLRMRLVRLSGASHCLVVVMHHIIGDGWSHAVLVRDIGAFYRAELSGRHQDRPGPLPIQYADYALWQRRFAQTPECAEQVDYWVSALRRVDDSLRLPRDSRVDAGEARGETVRFALPEALREPLLHAVADGRRLLSSILLAAYETTLARFADQESFPVGIAIANRTREETADLIGFFVNTLALPSDTDGSRSFGELVDRVQHRLLEAQTRQAAPFDRVAAGLGASGRWAENPIVKALFVLQNAPVPRFELPGLTASVERLRTGTSKFELTLFATEGGGSVDFELEYDARLFARETIESVRDAFLDVLAGCLMRPQASAFAFALEERARPSVCAGARRPEFSGESVPALIARQAHRMPDAVAIEADGLRLTYGQLYVAARAYAARLAECGVARGECVAVALPRSPELVVAILGVMVAGAAYAPMNPELPASYLNGLIDRLRPYALVIPEGHALAGVAGRRVCPVPDLRPSPRVSSPRGSEASSDVSVSPSDLACVIHTSGSTGLPKGVLVEHGGLANVCLWIAASIGIGPGDRCLLKTPVTFDAAARELYPVLIAGGTLVIADADAHRDITVLRRNLMSSGATVLHCVPTQLEALMGQGPLPPAVRAVMCGGEKLQAQTARRFRASEAARLWNVYGPTEATVDATAFGVDCDVAGDTVPIGRPIPNMTAIVMDRSGRAAPVGAIGEIHLMGVGVARGYLNAVESERAFTPDPVTGERRYATGDRGRIGAGGVIEFLGRRDRQVKRNGVRLEPAAIERAVLEHPAIGSAHVAVVEGGGAGPTRLIAFVAPHAQAPAGAHADAGADASAGAHAVAPESSDTADWRQATADWQSVFDTSYQTLAPEADARFNTHGWLDSVDRLPIAQEEILSAADEAAARIARWRPRRILEIGCGTGLLLFRLAPRCDSYHGVDFAQQALDYVEHHARAAALKNLRLTHASALDFVPDAASVYDVVVLNSVSQYLPSPAALSALLNRLAPHLAADGFFFIGDVRDLRLREAASLQRALRRAASQDRCAAVLYAAHIDGEREEELCLDPAFFAEWAAAGGRGVRFLAPLVEAKTSVGENELVKYRFDVTLARRPERAAAQPARLTATRLGHYRNRLVRGELNQLRKAENLPVCATVAELWGLSSETAQSAESLSPAEALARAGSAVSGQAGYRAICRMGGEPDQFEILQLPVEATVAQVATVAGCAFAQASRARPPGQFRRFLAATEDLVAFMRALLPSYEMPDQVIHLPRLPQTRHGKIDGEFLRVVAEDSRVRESEERSAGAQAGPVAAAICDVFAAVVGVPFGVDDDFFLRGGHSLLATQARARLSRHLGIEIPLRLIFDAPSARALAVEVHRLHGAAASGRDAIERRPNPVSACPSRAQSRLWFIEKLGTARTVYNMVHAVRTDGPLDLDAFDQAVGELIARHAPLRSRFPERDGRPTVVIDPPLMRGHVEKIGKGVPMPLEIALAALTARAALHFDLQSDRLVRVLVARIHPAAAGGPSHIVCMVVHHIVADGWSIALAMSELAGFYNRRTAGTGSAPEPIAVDYYDVAAWQTEAAARGAFDPDLRYWLAELQGLPPRLSMPYDFPLPSRRSWRGEKIEFEIPEELSRGVQALATRARATHFMTLLAVFEVLLHKLSGACDFAVGTVIANRHRPELEPLVGFLVNPLALRAVFEPSDTFETVLARVRNKSLAAFEHQDVPFEMILERLEVDRRTDYQAVFQVLFAMQNAGRIEFDFHGLRCERISLRLAGAMFDLSLEVREHGPTMHAELEYSADLFRPETARLFIDRYLMLLGIFAREPGIAIRDVSIVSPREGARILEFSQGQRSSGHEDETLPQRLFAVAAQDPVRAAVEDGAVRLTYGELAASIAFVAGCLRAVGVRRGDFVAVHLARGIPVALASFGIQSLGAAPVYIDPALPAQRKRAILRESGVGVCVTAHAVAGVDGVTWLETGSAEEWLREALSAPRHPFIPETQPEDIAFATFTSGSSGAPKVVIVSQRAIALRLRANDRVIAPLGSSDRVAHAYSFNYDGGLVTLFWPLCSGATLVFLPLDILGDAERLASALRVNRISVFDAIPAVLRDLFGERSGSAGGDWPLRLVVTGGDVCPADLPARVLEAADVLFANQYGPCEAVVNATTWTCDRRRMGSRATIGRPIPDTDIFIVDDRNRPCPIGVPGEILIGGPALAQGYLHAPELTAAKFVTLDLVGEGPQRLCRSGDVGRWTVEGEIEFLGRSDRQVQVRGMRSDPAEVEAAVRNSPVVAECHVAVEGEGERLGFVAYVVAVSDALSRDGAASGPEGVQRIAEWRTVFDGLYHPGKSRAAESDADYAGWDDTVTGEPIPIHDMQCWRTATLDRIRSVPVGRVLEIGAGLGLLALPLAREAELYVATDVSETAVQRLAQRARDLALENLIARRLGAEELDVLAGQTFDVIVLNSVAQYFPSGAFLRRTLESCGRLLAAGGRIFVGDVRDLSLSRMFHLEVAAARCGAGADPGYVRRVAAESERLDEELQIAPAFFSELPDGSGGTFRALPLLKIHSGNSEMARYRYDVWLWKGNAEAPAEVTRETLLPWSDQPGRLCNDPLLGRRMPRLRAALEAHVAECLPDHMRPGRYVFLDHMPAKPGGKIDTAALAELGLPPPEPRAEDGASDLPRAVMADLWRTLMGCEELSAEADFFALGGHSLLAARLAGAIRREFAVEFPVIRIFELRTLGAVTREVSRLRCLPAAPAVNGAAIPVIDWTRTQSAGDAPLSRNQRAILARLFAQSASRPHHIGLTVVPAANLDDVLLADALAVVAELHPMLRRRYAPDGRGFAGPFAPRLANGAGTSEIAAQVAAESLDIERDGPLSICSIRSPAGSAMLAVRAHAAFFDGDSLSILLGELAHVYNALSAGEDPCRGRSATDYGALAMWEATTEGQSAARCFAERWNGAVLPFGNAGAHRRDKPADAPEPVVNQVAWSQADTELLDRAAARVGVTSCAMLLGCFAMQAGRFGRELQIECPVSTRAALAAARVIGPFSVDLPLRFSSDTLGSVPDAALAASGQILRLFETYVMPLQDDGHAREFLRFAFSYQEGLEARARTTVHVSPLWTDLKLTARRAGAILHLRLTCDPSAFAVLDASRILAGMRETLFEWMGAT